MIGDITKEEDCNRLVDKAIEKFGYLNVLVCLFHYEKYTFTFTSVVKKQFNIGLHCLCTKLVKKCHFVKRRMRYPWFFFWFF